MSKHLLRWVRGRGGGRGVGFWGFCGVRNSLQLLRQNGMGDVVMPGKTCKRTRADKDRQLKEAADAKSESKCLLQSIVFISVLLVAAALMNDLVKCKA